MFQLSKPFSEPFCSYSSVSLLAISCQRHPWETEQQLLREPKEVFFSAEITTRQSGEATRARTAENVSVGPPEKNTKPPWEGWAGFWQGV